MKNFSVLKYVIPFAIFIILNVYDVYIVTALGMSLCVWSFLQYMDHLGTSLPVLYLMLFLCGYQWIGASYFSYVIGDTNYPMAVPEKEYMNKTVLFYIGLLIGSQFLGNKIYLSLELLKDFMNKKSNKYFAWYLLVIGGVSILVSTNIPYSLKFINYLLSALFYVAALMLIFSDYSKKWFVFIIVFGYLLLKVIQGGVFNEFLSWSMFVIMYLVSYFKINKFKITLIMVVGFFMISSLQAIKPYYRSIIWNNYEGNQLSLFVELYMDNLTGKLEEKGIDDKSLEDLNSRANQGWVFSKIYSHVPSVEPFANGVTIVNAIRDSFLPRFLFPNKRAVVQGDFFEKYTGRQLTSNTAMGLGILGEGYANFGILGNFIFMLLYGVVISLITGYFYKKALQYPILFFFVPLYFEMIIRAISNFSQVVNWQVKVAVFIYIVIYFYRRHSLKNG